MRDVRSRTSPATRKDSGTEDPHWRGNQATWSQWGKTGKLPLSNSQEARRLKQTLKHTKRGTGAAETSRPLVSWRYFSSCHWGLALRGKAFPGRRRHGQPLRSRGGGTDKPPYKALHRLPPDHLPPLIPFQILPATTQMLTSNNLSNLPSSAGCFFFLKDSAPHLPGKSLLVLHAPSHVALIRNFSLIPLSLLPSTLVSYQAQPTHYYFYYFVIIMNYYHHPIHQLSGAY